MISVDTAPSISAESRTPSTGPASQALVPVESIAVPLPLLAPAQTPAQAPVAATATGCALPLPVPAAAEAENGVPNMGDLIDFKTDTAAPSESLAISSTKDAVDALGGGAKGGERQTRGFTSIGGMRGSGENSEIEESETHGRTLVGGGKLWRPSSGGKKSTTRSRTVSFGSDMVEDDVGGVLCLCVRVIVCVAR